MKSYGMRFVRIPHIYLGDAFLKKMNKYSALILDVIYDIHNDIPNGFHDNSVARHYQYYPSFIYWIFDKSRAEIDRRGLKYTSQIPDEKRNLGSRSINNFIPPNDLEIAQDIVYILESWKDTRDTGGIKLPLSYVELVKRIYGYSPNERALTRIDELSGNHYHSDSGWYHV